MKKIFYNGQVYSGALPLCQAFVVEEDRFIYVGDSKEALAHKEEDSRLFDLKGRFVCAGFNDSHMHLLNYGSTLQMADLSGRTSSLQDMIACLQDFEKETRGREEWILGRGWNQDYFSGDKSFPTCRDLDQISRQRPVCIIRACGHCCAVNSKALEQIGVSAGTPQPEGGRYECFPDGTPNGIFRENALDMVYSKIPLPGIPQIKDMLLRAMAKANTYGVTSCQTDDLRTFDVPFSHVIQAYRQLEAEGKMTVRINEQAQLMTRERLEEFWQAGFYTGTGSHFFKIGPLKIVADGSLGSRSAYLSRPYADAPQTQGMALLSQAELDQLIYMAHKNHMQIAVHAIGDGALDMVLDAYEKAVGEEPAQDRRHGIVHCQITRPEQIKRMARLKLMAYVQTIFLDYDIRIVRERAGDALAETSYAFASLKRAGVHVSNGSDCPVEAPDVLAGIQCAVTRKSLDGAVGPYRPEEAMTLWEALDSYTKEGARASFEEYIKGRIRPGMLADFVVLEQNPQNTASDQIKNIPVHSTWVGGRCVYEKI